jgi:hypothetical protein
MGRDGAHVRRFLVRRQPLRGSEIDDRRSFLRLRSRCQVERSGIRSGNHDWSFLVRVIATAEFPVATRAHTIILFGLFCQSFSYLALTACH